jgi:hypothetical protein
MHFIRSDHILRIKIGTAREKSYLLPLRKMSSSIALVVIVACAMVGLSSAAIQQDQVTSLPGIALIFHGTFLIM